MMLHKQVMHFKKKITQERTTEFGDPQSPYCFRVYGLPFTDSVIVHMQDKMEAISGCKLYPTFSYGRINFNGGTLPKHVDRHSCEFSATICLHNDPDPWPIFMDGEEIIMYPGDMVFYKGCKVPHWREPFTGKRQIQLFIHYVDTRGEYRDHVFDKRISLGFPYGVGKTKQNGV